MAFAPVDYGPQLHTDDEGYYELRNQQRRVLGNIEQLGATIEGGAKALVQGRLHTQALQATAAVKEKQAQTLQFIDSNPYVDKTDLQQRMGPEAYEAWHAGLGAEYKDAKTVPMFTAAGALFDSEAKQARDSAGQVISLPGWRNKWDATERTESSTIRERYVNRLAADQMIADQRAQTLIAVDKMVDGAVKPEDIEAAAKAAETSPWLKPAERRFTMEKALVAKDSFVARQAMLGLDTAVMKAELSKLRSDNAAELYPNMNVKQRLDLANQLGREYGFKAAKEVAENKIVGPNVDENGKVDRTAIAKALAAYDGPNKEDVTKAVKVEESQKLDIFDKQMAEVQQSILRAGQDPMTGRFSYARAMQNPDARKAATQLNRDAPGLITALSKEDVRWDNIDAKATALEQREARAALIKASGENLEALHRSLDDPAQSDVFKSMTPAQFDVQLYNRGMTEPDRQKARAAFAAFKKAGGPDERAATIVASEIAAAANGDTLKTKKFMAKYGDALRVEAHAFIRAHPELPPDKMSDALREDLRSKMLRGDVVGSGRLLDDTVPRIEWETNPKYAGKPFKMKDGTVIKNQVQTDADFDALPSGATFTGPDGKVRRKP